MKAAMLRSLTVLITREDERALIVLARAMEMTKDQFISQVTRRTFAEYWARVEADRAAAKLPEAEVKVSGEVIPGTPDDPALGVRIGGLEDEDAGISIEEELARR